MPSGGESKRVAQLERCGRSSVVEPQPSKLVVVGSSPIARSTFLCKLFRKGGRRVTEKERDKMALLWLSR